MKCNINPRWEIQEEDFIRKKNVLDFNHILKRVRITLLQINFLAFSYCINSASLDAREV